MRAYRPDCQSFRQGRRPRRERGAAVLRTSDDFWYYSDDDEGDVDAVGELDARRRCSQNAVASRPLELRPCFSRRPEAIRMKRILLSATAGLILLGQNAQAAMED